MEANTILQQVKQSGLRIKLKGCRIALGPRTKISSSIRELVRDNRDDITLAIKNAPSRLVKLAIHAGIHEQGIQFSPSDIRRLVNNEDLQDVVNCTRNEMQAWASALAIRATQRRGKMPRGWDKVAHCTHCGPVYSFHDLDTLTCGWCELRLAGKWFPVPDQEETI